MSEVSTVRVPTQDRAVRTRAALVAAAQREFSKNGYASTTARTIAKDAGVSTGSFYQYFVDKDAVLRELGRARFEGIARRVLSTLTQYDASEAGVAPGIDVVRTLLREVVVAVVEYHQEDPGLHAVLTERRSHDPELDAVTTMGEKLLMQKVAKLLEIWGHGGDVEATSFVIFNMVEGTVHAHVLGHSMVSDERFFAALVDAVTRVALGDRTRRSES
jgi:AcrR family transcriptional regulator